MIVTVLYFRISGFSYGWQVAANVSANGLTADAFTNVSLSDIGKAALVTGY